MAKSKQLTTEHTALVLAVLSGDATTEQISELDLLLRSRPELIESFVDLVGQDAWLAWSSSNDLPRREYTRFPAAAHFVGDHQGMTSALPRRATNDSWSWKWSLAASIALVTTGAMIGAIGLHNYSPRPVAKNSSNREDRVNAPERDYSARVVETSACRWNPARAIPPLTNSEIRKGESVNLLEGLAQLSIEKASCRSILDIEGPAAVVLTADVGCSISHGRVCADVQSFGDPFTIDTPSCLVRAVGDRSDFGVAVDGRRVEVHVFGGKVNVVVPWGIGQDDSLNSELQAGDSLILEPDSVGRMARTRASANPRSFTARTSMRSNHLVIPDRYPDAVLSQNPLLYWRFESGDTQEIENVAGEQYRGIVHGKLFARSDGSNGYIDFGGGVSQEELAAFITTEEPIAIGDNDTYSLEMWLKPSHCHHCAWRAPFCRSRTRI